MNDPKNYYITVSVQVESDMEALTVAAKIAATVQESAQLRRCGTKQHIATVMSDGTLLIPIKQKDS